MSINPLTVDTLTIKRINPSPSIDDSGGYDENAEYATIHRGSLPTTVQGRATLMRPQEAAMLGTTTTNATWVFRSKENMDVDNRDMIEWTDADGVARRARIIIASRRVSRASGVYRAVGIERGANG